ncbi:MAG: hypothetical protein NT018_03195 [Armatimonadetes bacterium]|nr:hypothetical protein [Armatimonadota bacterium]
MKIKSFVIRTILLFLWIGIAVVGSVIYGALNDQVTVTISPEYYNVYKHRQFAPALEYLGLINSPLRFQASVIGAIATWWYGLFFGIMLGISSMVGRYDALPTRRYVYALSHVAVITFCVSVVFGGIAYLIEPLIKPDANDWAFLSEIHDVRRAFCVGWWHNGAYIGAFSATLWVCFWAQKQRRNFAASQPK